MTTYLDTARPACAERPLCIDTQLWALWDVPQVKAWLLEVPLQQRLKRLERIGQLWEGSTRWALMRSLNPELDPGVLETLTAAPNPGPFNPVHLTPPSELERLVLEIGAADGYAWAAHNSPQRIELLAQVYWSKERVWHPELQAWMNQP